MDAPALSLFETELAEDTLIITPIRSLGEFECAHIDDDAERLWKLWGTIDAKNVIVDFHRTDYCGSTALGLLVELRQRVQSRKGRMLLCGVSAHEREIFAVTRLDSLWLVCSSREEALGIIRQQTATQPLPAKPG
jgi:anti-anti-sigma factor